MQPIPAPQLLDPNRVLDNDRNDLTPDHEARAALLEDALHGTCAYAQQLWENLEAMRGYLMTSLPSDPRSPGPHPRASAAPTGPDDEAGWQDWIDAYSSVTSVLCGPHGDSGFGLGEARHAADLRRSAPNLRLVSEHAEIFPTPGAAAAHAQTTAAEPVRDSQPARAAQPAKSQPARVAATAVLVALAIRGLLPRRRPRRPL